MSALTFVGLGARANELISSFSYGHQRLIEIARALAANPTLLLLDEPAAGLNSTEKLELHELLKRIAAQGLTILIIDHDMTLVSRGGPAHHRAQFRTPHRGRRIHGGAASSRRRLRLSRERMMALLQINDLIVLYGEIEALRGVSLSVEEGQVVTLLGANGAGKSTTLRAISGLAKPAAGEILFDGKSIAGLGPEAIVRLGISHVPEGRRIFPGLTVKENIMLGASNRRVGKAAAVARSRRHVRPVSGHPAIRQCAGLDPVGRPVADGGGRARPDGQAAAAAARRAVAGAGARHRAGGVPDHFGDPPQHHGACWSSRTRAWDFRWPITATCWKPAASCSAASPTNCGATKPSPPPISAAMPKHVPDNAPSCRNPGGDSNARLVATANQSATSRTTGCRSATTAD